MREVTAQAIEEIDANFEAGEFEVAKAQIFSVPGFLQDRELLLRLAKISEMLEDNAGATKFWTYLVREQPHEAKNWVSLARMQARAGDAGTAMECLHQALRIEPNLIEAHRSLAIVYSWIRSPNLSLEHANFVLEQEPDDVEARLLRSRAHLALNLPELAENDLRKVGDSGQLSPELGILEAQFHHQQEDFELALTVASEICESVPENLHALREFRQIFSDFQNVRYRSRYLEFIDGVGVDLPETMPRPQIHFQRKVAEKSIDIVIPVYNNIEDLKLCLASIQRCACKRMSKIILVDDHSDAATQDYLQSVQTDRIVVVRSSENLGFTGALALGISESDARFFVALNSDTEVSKGWLRKLIDVCEQDQSTLMVGPMSNGAAWQNTGGITDHNGDFTSAELKETMTADVMSVVLEELAHFGPPTNPLVHGFCVLVDRKKYDEVGGLDTNEFAGGYGEFQDLCLRAMEQGYHSRIATNCFVYHQRGKSIEAESRSERSLRARKNLYQRHGALKYLCAEAVSICNPFVELIRKQVAQIDPDDLLHPVPRTAAWRLFKRQSMEPSPKRVCCIVMHSEEGELGAHVIRQAQAYRRHSFQVVLVVNSERARQLQPDSFLEIADAVLLRDNIGFDFGGWADAFRALSELSQSEIVIFTNDSILGPLGPETRFDQLIENLLLTDKSYFCFTESNVEHPHFQSYFWGVKGKAFSQGPLSSYWEGLNNAPSLPLCVEKYEIFLKFVLEQIGGLDGLVAFPNAELLAPEMVATTEVNPMRSHWHTLLEKGLPFLRIKVAQMLLARGKSDLLDAALQSIGEETNTLSEYLERLRLTKMQLRIDRNSGDHDSTTALRNSACAQLVPKVCDAQLVDQTHCLLTIFYFLDSEDLSDVMETIAAISSVPKGLCEVFVVSVQSQQTDKLKSELKALPTSKDIEFIDCNAKALATELAHILTERAGGQYFTLLKTGERLLPNAVAHLLDASLNRPELKALYTDDEILDPSDGNWGVQLKPEWNQEYFYSQDYVEGSVYFDRSMAHLLKGMVQYSLAQLRYALLLRAADGYDGQNIGHIPHVSFAASKDLSSLEEKRLILSSHFQLKFDSDISVEEGQAPGTFRPIWNPQSEPKVSIIIPTRDAFHLVRRTVETLLDRTTYSNFEVILIDNGSECPDVLRWFCEIEKLEPKLVIHRNTEAFNYSRLNNLGIRAASGEYLVFLNNDVEIISEHWLSEMVSLGQRDDIGCVGAKLYYPNDTIQHAGVSLGGAHGHATHLFTGCKRTDPGPMNRLVTRQEVLAVTAACMLVRKSTFLDVGGFDEENLAVSFNDVDLCLSVNALGLRNIWTPFAELLHHESATRGHDDTLEKRARALTEWRFLCDRWALNHICDSWAHRNTVLRPGKISVSSVGSLGILNN